MARTVRLVIAGSRGLNNYEKIKDIIHRYLQVHNLQCSDIEIVTGECPTGVDLCARMFAYEYDVPLMTMVAEWKKYGKAAGPKRNRRMAEYGHQLLAVWDGSSPGTKSMFTEMAKLDKPVYLVNVARLLSRSV